MNENAIPGAPEEFVNVFVSYAREDRRWLDPDHRFSLIPFLMESLRRHKVAFWFDKELKPGDEFKRHIQSQIDQSQIALLIVSQSFLNSEFIESKEMPRIAERARQGQMIVVPVLVEPCDWSEYPFLADRQMVPSSPLIEYTESEPQWVKIRFQILDGLKAQVKRIREAPQSHAIPAAALNTRHTPPEEAIIGPGAIPSDQPGPGQQDEQPEEELDRVAREAAEQEAAKREAAAQAALRAEQEAEQVRQQREHEAEERSKREKEQEALRLREAAELEAAAQAALRAEQEAAQIRQQREREAAEHEGTRISRIWAAAVAGGAALLGLVALAYFGLTTDIWFRSWFEAVTGGAPLVALVCLLAFKPFPRNRAPAIVGGAAVAAVVWLYLVIFAPFLLLNAAIDGAPLVVVLVCLLVFKPFPRNWTRAVAGGALVVWAYLAFFITSWRLSELGVMGWAALAVVLVCFQGLKPLPRYWSRAVVGGALVWVCLAFFDPHSARSFLLVMDGAALVVALVCLLVFIVRGKP
jgi:hypothetical protein